MLDATRGGHYNCSRRGERSARAGKLGAMVRGGATHEPTNIVWEDAMTLEDLEHRVRVLEDIDAIKEVTYRYLYHCDDSYNPDGIASLFTEDGVRDQGSQGRIVGREAVRATFAEASKRTVFAAHFGFNPIVTVNGDEAHASWYTFQTFTVRGDDGDRAMWRAGRYENDMVRVNGEWKFKLMVTSETFFTPYDQGWAKLRSVTGAS